MSCQDEDLIMKYNESDYTEKEKARFKSDNLCMRFFYNSTEKVIDENTCYDSIVATANEDSAISCGYYEYTLYFLNGTSEKLKTCLLFNDDMVKNKNFGFWNRMYSLFNVMVKASEFNKTLSHYRISFSNSKGNNLIYDSETDTIIDGDSEEEEQDEEKKEEQQEEDEKEKEKEDEKEN